MFILGQNFFVHIVESQLSNLTDQNGQPSHIGNVFDAVDKVFTILFAAELMLNALSHWFKPFIADGWNLFDVMVVSVSLFTLGPLKLPFNVVRSLRAFRVIRLFRRIKGFERIVAALSSSVIPVLQALLVFLITGSICKAPCHRSF